MKRVTGALLVLVAVAGLLAGCATTFKAADGKLAYGEIRGVAKGEIDVKKSYMYIISPYLIPLSKPYENIDSVVGPALVRKGANAIANLEIDEGFTFVDMLLTGLTGSFLGFRYVSVRGTAVQQ